MRIVFVALMGLGMTGQLSHAASRSKSATEPTTVEAVRLVVSDANAPVIRVIDIATRRTIATFTVNSPARLHAGSSGRYVYAVQAEASQVAIIDTGIATDSHGDHIDVSISKPRLLSARLHGPQPSHVTHDGVRTAVFFDGDGTARLITEQELAGDKAGRFQRIETGARHHGVAQPIGRWLAVTVPPDADGLPNAIELRGPENAPSYRTGCPRAHGEGRTGPFFAFGCAEGLVIYKAERGAVTARTLPYPASLPAGRMIRSLAGATGFSLLVGDFGGDGMVTFDPAAPDGDFRFTALPGRRMHFNLHPDPGDKLFVIVEDGTLLMINPMTGQVAGQTRVTDRYAMDQGVVRPRIASAGRHVFVSNPAASEMVVLDAATLKEHRRIKLTHVTFDVIAVGASGKRH